MTEWTAYPIFGATLISVIGLSTLAKKSQLASSGNQPLSEIVASEERALAHFKNILVTCGLLYAITVFGYLAPRANSPVFIYVFGVLMIGAELLVALIPASGKNIKVHVACAYIMAAGMLGLAATLWLTQTGAFSVAEAACTFALCAFAILMTANRKYYLIYELGYIFVSHLSLVTAVIVIR